MKRILCLWLSNWPIQHLVVAKPELESRPVVLYEVGRGGSQYVVTCSPAARELGVRPSMPLAEAAVLGQVGALGQVPTLGQGLSALHCQTYDPEGDREALATLAQWSQRYSPLVGVEEGERPESLLLDVTGLAPLFGNESLLARRIEKGLARRGYQGQIAVADTVGAAWAVAHYAVAPHQEERRVSFQKVGKGSSKRSGAGEAAEGAFAEWASGSPFVVDRGDARRRLDLLPVEALRLPEETVSLLNRLGVQKIGQVASLPRAELASRFSGCLLRLDQATGAVSEGITAQRDRPDLVAEWSFEIPTGQLRLVEQVTSALIERLVVMLGERDRGALQLICRLDCQSLDCQSLDCQSEKPGTSRVTLTVGLFEPSADLKHLRELMQMQLESIRLTGPVTKVRVSVPSSALLEERQKKLFVEARSGQNPRELAALIDRLVGRLGRQAVLRVRMVADAQPERAYRGEPFVGTKPRRRSSAGRTIRTKGTRTEQRETKGPLQRPLQLVSRPQPVKVIAVVPEGPPGQFEWKGQLYPVARHWGPERIETGWWRKAPVLRDYYRVETIAGQRFWLFRRLRDGAWFFHGEFG